MTLVEFLLARIAEDEEDPWRGAELVGSDRIVGTAEQKALEEEEREWVARILAECAAKRAIVERHATITEATRQAAANYQAWLDNAPDPYPEVSSRAHAQDVAAELEDVLHHLAAVYADHPDYREEWRQ